MAVFLSILGCANLTRARLSNVSKIHGGQTPDEVASKIGRPKKKVKRENFETWYYDLYSDDSASKYSYKAVFRDGRLTDFDGDYSSVSEERDLVQKRDSSKQTLSFFGNNSTNGAPPLKRTSSDQEGTIPKNHIGEDPKKFRP